MRDYIDYTFQANQIILDTITNHAITDEKILRTMSHIILSAQSIISQIKQQPAQEETFVIRPTKELIAINRENKENLLILLEQMPQNTMIPFTGKDGRDLSNCLHDFMHHLFFHAAHHRGQISMLLSERVKLPSEINYIAFSAKHKQLKSKANA